MGILDDCKRSSPSPSLSRAGVKTDKVQWVRKKRNVHCDTRGRSKKIMAENRICITGLRRSKVPAVRAPLLSLFVVRSLDVYVFSFFSTRSRSEKWYSNDRARSRTRSSSSLTFAYLPFTRTLKPHCNVLLHSHERLGRLSSRVSPKWLR